MTRLQKLAMKVIMYASNRLIITKYLLGLIFLSSLLSLTGVLILNYIVLVLSNLFVLQHNRRDFTIIPPKRRASGAENASYLVGTIV
jgi:hypothetical protein